MDKKANRSLSDNDFSAMLQRKVENTLVANTYKQANVGLVATLACATILFGGIFSVTNHILLATWYVVFWLICIIRYFLTKAYLREKDSEKNISKWKNRFIVGAAIGGLSWGFAGSIMLPYDNVMAFVLTVLILTGITAGAVPLLSGILAAVIAYLIGALVPLFICLLVIDNTTFLYYDCAVFVYLCYLLVLSKKSHQVSKNAITLQYQNDILLRHLSEAKEELEEANKKLEQAATNDPLTQVLNRNALEKKFIKIINRAEWGQRSFALMCLDLDNFKEINQTYGHLVGDLLLQKAIERIQRILPKNSISARTGGDEFVLVFEDISNPEEAIDFAKKICDAIALPFEIQDYTILETISIGISIFPVDGRTFEMLLKNANKALHVAQENKGNNYHFNTDLGTIKTALTNLFPKIGSN